MAYHVVGWLAFAFSLECFARNTPLRQGYDTGGTTATQPMAVQLGVLAACELLTVYGALTLKPPLLGGGGIGMVVAVWMLVASPAGDRQRVGIGAAVVAVSVVVAVAVVHSVADRAVAVTWAGSLACTASVLLLRTPTIGLRDVVDRCGARATLVVGLFAAAASLWLLYAALNSDAFILLPSGFALGLSLLRLKSVLGRPVDAAKLPMLTRPAAV